MHRGEFLSKIVVGKNKNISKLVAAVGYERSSYYLHIKKADLSYKILKKYGDAIPYDFSKDFPDMINEISADEFVINTFEGMEEDRDFWRDEFGRVLKETKLLKEEIVLLKEEIKTLKSKK